MSVRSRLAAWWDVAVTDWRDRCVDAVADWWTRAVLEPRYGIQDRVAEWGERAADRHAQLSDRAREVPLLTVLGVVVAAAAAGWLVALGGPWEPERGTAARAAPARAVAAPGERLATRLGAIFGHLQVERSRARARLASSRTPRRQGTAAHKLADAYRSGARKVAATAGRPRASAGVRGSMRAAAAAYDALATAAVKGDRRRFSAARLRVARAENAVRDAL